ncbi:dynein intermediate chain 3, ciliary [Haematobia irritans]|uniref:dynein intermediate chain 3, ciliary n=1 Tax=Haematobia irritans TaxID=7368 RepID=UPI003F4FE4E4
MFSANQYCYTRERRRFGRQCLFSDRNQLMFSINPSRKERCNYILRNPVNDGTQSAPQKAFSIMQTENVTMGEHGLYHYEGGWPSDVNKNDEEATLRHRKKIERDDNWGMQVVGLIRTSIDFAEDNNTVNIYEDFFLDLPPEINVKIKSQFEPRQKNSFHDLENNHRPIAVLGWVPNDVQRFLIVHTNIALQREIPLEETTKKKEQPKDNAEKNKYLLKHQIVEEDIAMDSNDFYIWNFEYPLKPLTIFNSNEKVKTAAYCPRDESWIAGAFQSGKICLWDSRISGHPIAVCPLETAHRETASALCWVHSKTNSEFYTGSYDGSVKFWDIRNMEKPFYDLLLDTEKTDEQSRERAHGVTVLEFEYTIPIRFIIGSDMGSVFVGNRKGSTPMEILDAGNFRLFNGPIRTIERNPFFVKNFLITGDWCAKIWAEEYKSSPSTLFIKKNNQILCGTWSTARCSLFVTGDTEGELDFWDLLLHQRKPIFSMKYSNPIVYAKFHPTGEYLAVGFDNGDTEIFELDPGLKQSTNKDKALIAAMFEREQLRCKLLDGRVEEIKLKQRITLAENETAVIEDRQQHIQELVDINDSDEFLRIISSDVEFRDIFNNFQDLTLKVEKKRQEREYVMERTDFEVARSSTSKQPSIKENINN